MKTQTEALTIDMIRKLRAEANAAGDDALGEAAKVALLGWPRARAACAKAISDARAMDDDQPFILVVA